MQSLVIIQELIESLCVAGGGGSSKRHNTFLWQQSVLAAVATGSRDSWLTFAVPLVRISFCCPRYLRAAAGIPFSFSEARSHLNYAVLLSSQGANCDVSASGLRMGLHVSMEPMSLARNWAGSVLVEGGGGVSLFNLAMWHRGSAQHISSGCTPPDFEWSVALFSIVSVCFTGAREEATAPVWKADTPKRWRTSRGPAGQVPCSSRDSWAVRHLRQEPRKHFQLPIRWSHVQCFVNGHQFPERGRERAPEILSSMGLCLDFSWISSTPMGLASIVEVCGA